MLPVSREKSRDNFYNTAFVSIEKARDHVHDAQYVVVRREQKRKQATSYDNYYHKRHAWDRNIDHGVGPTFKYEDRTRGLNIMQIPAHCRKVRVKRGSNL